MSGSIDNPPARQAADALCQQAAVRHDGHDDGPYQSLLLLGALAPSALAQCLREGAGDDAATQAALRSHGGLSNVQIGLALAAWHGVPYEPYQPLRVRDAVLHGRLPRSRAMAQQWIALEMIGDALLVMCTDPQGTRRSQVVAQRHPAVARCVYAVTTHAEFMQTVTQLCGDDAEPPALQAVLDTLINSRAMAADDASLQTSPAAVEPSDNELVRFVNRILADAIAQGASDIHIEPSPAAGATLIRFRVDGVLRRHVEVPARFRPALVTRLKIMARLDIAERRKPQDGKLKFLHGELPEIELRMVTLPTAGDVEDVVLRLLHAGASRTLDEIDLRAHHRAQMLRLLERPHGLFYVCGPTGSGKTTTLHAVLRALNNGERKIWTAEDPVEITQPGLRQVQINRKAGIDFSVLMRAFLRADPDVIMVGESRDRETVAMSVEASHTGHLVLSTLHTNSAPEAVVRLLDMGMDPFNFADALQGVLAQRLVRRLCDCAQPLEASHQTLFKLAQEYLAEIGAAAVQPDDDAATLALKWQRQGVDGEPLRLRQHAGCAHCQHSGFRGRVALHELMLSDDRIRALVHERARVSLIGCAAVQAGMRTLKMDGIEKVLLGLTDIQQVRGVAMR